MSSQVTDSPAEPTVHSASETLVSVAKPQPRLTDAELAEVDARMEYLPASKIISWAVETFGERLCLTASMADTVLLDLAAKVKPDLDVFFIDTGYHFPETLETVERVRARYDLSINVVRNPAELDDQWLDDPDGCCDARKVKPLNDALAGKAAWMSGLRRGETEARANARIVSRDRRGLVKVNPIANWTDLDVEGYIEANDLIVNPLLEQGYPSIGCWPCTRKVAPGEDARAGRWTGFTKTECGLHL